MHCGIGARIFYFFPVKVRFKLQSFSENNNFIVYLMFWYIYFDYINVQKSAENGRIDWLTYSL